MSCMHYFIKLNITIVQWHSSFSPYIKYINNELCCTEWKKSSPQLYVYVITAVFIQVTEHCPRVWCSGMRKWLIVITIVQGHSSLSPYICTWTIWTLTYRVQKLILELDSSVYTGNWTLSSGVIQQHTLVAQSNYYNSTGFTVHCLYFCTLFIMNFDV